MDVSDQKGHGRALQLTPSFGENGPWCRFMTCAESCLAQVYVSALDRNLCGGSQGSSPGAEPLKCPTPPQHPHYIPARSPAGGQQGNSGSDDERWPLSS